MSMKLVKQKGKINIVSAYAPQVGCSLDEKEAFWEELEGLIRGFPEDEQVIIVADLNGHVGTENGGYEQWHGGKIQNNKACDPDGVPVEAIRLLMQYCEDRVLQTTNEVVINGMPDMWRSTIITPIFKGKGSAMKCSNYRGIKLLCHAMKLYERMVENRLRKQIDISSNQYGFIPGKSTIEPIFVTHL